MKLITVVLSGGSGTRLWPASREAYPKPFMVLSGSTLLEQAIVRGQACGCDELLIVTNKDHFHITQNLVASMEEPSSVSYILEPKGRNTAPAVALAAMNVMKRYGQDAVMLVLPADHLIPNTTEFVANVLEAAKYAQQGKITLFGIKPDRPDVGFGYVQVARPDNEVQSAIRFVEKPSLSKASEYLSSGCFYWNSGMLCCTSGVMIEALGMHSPEVLAAAEKTMSSAKIEIKENGSQGIVSFDADIFSLQPNISIDYAVMERATNVMLLPARFNWSDVGTWPAVANAFTPDTNGNTISCDENINWTNLDTSNTHVHMETHGHKQVVATIGIDNAIIVHTPDVLLIASKDKAEKVKEVVSALKERNIDSPSFQSTILPSVINRPWGKYSTLKEENGYKVKRIIVNQNSSLSLQYHKHRAEHWVVVKGNGIVQIGDVHHPVGPGMYKYIPVEKEHRLTNTGQETLVLIEVQIGEYLGEDDIVRIEDIYGRV